MKTKHREFSGTMDERIVRALTRQMDGAAQDAPDWSKDELVEWAADMMAGGRSCGDDDREACGAFASMHYNDQEKLMKRAAKSY